MVLFGNRPRERRGVGPADHPRRRAGAGPLRLHLRDLRLAWRRRDLDQLPGHLARSTSRWRSAYYLHGGWKKARMTAGERPDTDECTEEALATREPGGALNPPAELHQGAGAMIDSVRRRGDAKAARMICFLPSLAHAPRPLERMDALDARREPASPVRFHLAAVHLRGPRLRGADRRRFPASAAGASTVSAPRRAKPPTSASRASRSSPTRRKSCAPSDAEEALNSDNLICRAIKAIKDAVPEIGVLTDVALDPYTAHGHDGMIDGRATSSTTRRSRSSSSRRWSRPRPAPTSSPLRHDGRPRRSDPQGARGEGHQNVAIMAYAAKYASAFYGPFREAVGSLGRLKGRQARLPDGPGEHRGSAARGRARPRRRRRLRDGQARAALSRRRARG